MRLCIVGIGGCGGHLAEHFLKNEDVTILKKSLGDHVSFGGVKGLWLEADVQETDNQDFFGSLERGEYPGYLIPHDVIKSDSKASRAVQDRYGYDIKKQGFMRQAEFLKAIFEIFDTDEVVKSATLSEYESTNPILRSAWDHIRPCTTLAGAENNNKASELCDGILFLISLGGGTGTGFVNPITGYIRRERSAYPAFVLAVLTEEGVDPQQRAKEAKRDMGAMISLYDLVTKKSGIGVDGVILVDNQIMIEKFGQDYPAIDQYIYQAMKPFVARHHYPGENLPSLALREKFLEGLPQPPILVPCYHRMKRHNDPEDELVKRALSEEGQLFRCDPKMAERAYVFTRGFMEFDEIVNAVAKYTGLSKDRVEPWRKLGENKWDEVLILLRNPYGGKDRACENKVTLEYRLHRTLRMALKYMDDPESNLIPEGMPDKTRDALEDYFYGKTGIKSEFKRSLTRIEKGEKPFFLNEKNIFEDKSERSFENNENHENLPDDEKIRKIVMEEVAKILGERA